MTAFQDNSFQGETLFGTYYPKGYVIATCNDGAAAQGAHRVLTQQGFAQTRIWTGEEVIAQHDALAAQRNAEWQRGSSLQANNNLGLQDYMHAAQHGAFFVTLHVPDETMVEQARATLAAYQPRIVHYYGSVGVVDLGAHSTTTPGITPTTGKVNEPSGPPPAAPDEAQRDPAW